MLLEPLPMVCDQVREEAVVNVPVPAEELVPVVMAASTWDHSCWVCGSMGVAVSTVPVRYSSSQSPPKAARPVASVLAATSAPVSWEIWSTRKRPSGEAAISQP